MTSPAGRTWYSPEPVTACPALHYMGIYVPLSLMRRNARTFADIAEGQAALARHQLLRIFLRVNYRLMLNAKIGTNAKAFIEWDSASDHGLPLSLIHI